LISLTLVFCNFNQEKTMLSFIVNGQQVTVDASGDTPLLWVLRDHLRLTGTKFGCGAGLCGACTVHLDGQALRSCALPVAAAVNKSVTTIEGLSHKGDHPLQEAWVAENAPQCGYCQSGQIMSAAALLQQNPTPDDAAIDQAMAGNICRCGSYLRIRKAIHRAASAQPVQYHMPSDQTLSQQEDA
jgi:isoquinoline 1-oxidoreductase alpha subunit